MPWSCSSIMDQKTQFIADYLRQTLPFTELCALYHVSRKTGYKWAARYAELGASGLEDRPRRPRPHPALALALRLLLHTLPLRPHPQAPPAPPARPPGSADLAHHGTE